jgi:hypothetical protein
MAEEVRIVAKLDTKDVDNGVDRINQATARMRQAVSDQANIPASDADKAGGNVATAFANGFIKRLVIRDAIYGMLRGLTNVASDVGQDIADALGSKLPKGGFLAGFEKWIADGVFSILEGLIPSLAKRDVITRGQNIAQIQSDEEQRFRNELYKEDPTTFHKASSTVQDQLNIQYQAIAQAKVANQKFHEAWAEFQSRAREPQGITESAGAYYLRTHKDFKQPAGTMNDEVLAAVIADREKDIKQLEFEKGIAEKRDTMEKSAERKEAAAEVKQEKAEAAAEKKEKTAQERADEARAAVEKKQEEYRLNEERADISKKPAEVDLRSTEKQLDHLRATSAVMIGGQLFGRNDSAIQQVRLATEQVSALRTINATLEKIRQEKAELTLI